MRRRSIEQKQAARMALSDQDWEACKQWWRDESVINRVAFQEHICKSHADPMTERMSLMAQLVLDRLLAEVWPGPFAGDRPTSKEQA